MSEATIWKDGAFRPDAWVQHAPEAAVAGDAPLLVPLAAFLAEPERFLAHKGSLGVSVAAGEAIDALAPYLSRLAMIALAFPKFSDGRSYSAARLLRERMSFEGELRAYGDVLSDQIPLMRRCGIDSFEVVHSRRAPRSRPTGSPRCTTSTSRSQPPRMRRQPARGRG